MKVMTKRVAQSSSKREAQPIKYTRPRGKFKLGLHSRCEDFADVMEKHLNIRLKEETSFLIDLCKRQYRDEYIEWFNTTEQRNPSLISKEVSRLTSKKNPIDFYSKEGKYIIGKSLLDSFVRTKRNEVINLRKALGLEHRKYSNKNIILTNGIEHSDIFRLFGSPLTIEDLRTNYKKLAKKIHPDVGGSEDLMSRVSGLYNVLIEDWDKYDPANLALTNEPSYSEILNHKLEDPEMINLLDF